MTRWLDDDELRYWRAWLTATALVPEQLGRDLQAAHGITLAEYDILVQLSEAQEHALRMSTLATRALVSRSRLTHQIDRMEAEGLVKREACTNDGRGLRAVMTDRGWEVLRNAAPDHAESIRRHFVDLLTPQEFKALGKASAKVVAAVASTVDTPRS